MENFGFTGAGGGRTPPPFEGSPAERSKAAFAWETAEGKPRTVYASYRFTSLTEIDAVKGTFCADFYVYLHWFDLGMVDLPDGAFGRTEAEYAQLWNPRIEVNRTMDVTQLLSENDAWNFKNKKPASQADNEPLWRPGMMKYTQRFRGTIEFDPDMMNFPFDGSHLVVSIGCRVYGNTKVVLAYEPTFVPGHIPVNLHEWHLVPAVGLVVAEKPTFNSSKVYSNLNITLMVSRYYSYFVYKIMITKFILNIWTWATFWMDPFDISARFDVLLNLFIASIAFQFVIGDKLPQVSFLTTMDIFLLMSNGTIMICATEALAVYLIAKDYDNPEDLGPNSSAVTVDRYCRFIVPLSYVVGVVILILRGLRIRQKMMMSAGDLIPIKKIKVQGAEPHNSGYLETNK